MSYLNKIGINVLYKVAIMNAKDCFNFSAYDCDKLISNQLVAKTLSLYGLDFLKNDRSCITFIIILLQIHVLIHMNVSCHNIDMIK